MPAKLSYLNPRSQLEQLRRDLDRVGLHVGEQRDVEGQARGSADADRLLLQGSPRRALEGLPDRQWAWSRVCSNSVPP